MTETTTAGFTPLQGQYLAFIRTYALAPDPTQWLATSESDRHEVVQRHHTRTNFQGKSLKMHAVIHVVIENQLAEGHPAATAAMGRLLTEGLDRHNAIHAIGDVLSREMYAAVTENRLHDSQLYARNLNQLTAAAWLASSAEVRT